MELSKSFDRFLRHVANLKNRVVGPRRDILSHSLGWRAPKVPHEILPDMAATVTDVRIAQRLLTAYSKSQSFVSTASRDASGDLWSVIRKQQASFLNLLDHGEAQLNVPELIRENGGFRRISRVPYWLRKGYVSELYSIK